MELSVTVHRAHWGVDIQFFWPELGVNVKFELAEVAPGGYCEVRVSLPRNTSERRLATMKWIITLELELLKAIMEDNLDDISPLTFHHVEAYHLSLYGMDTRMCLPDDALQKYNFEGELVRDGNLYDIMSTDFALTVSTKPQGILIPKNARDVQAAIKMALDYNIPLAARGSQVSHSAGGQAQSDNGLLLDMSPLSFVEIAQDGLSVKVGPGTFWDEVWYYV